MNHTQNLHLPQWEADDRIMRTDFNDAMASIDTGVKALQTAVNGKTTPAEVSAAISAATAGFGNCRIAYGTYNGTGTYGSDNQNSLNFSFEPKLVIVQNTNYAKALINGSDEMEKGMLIALRPLAIFWESANWTLSLSWEQNALHWYNPTNAELQLNKSGNTYLYLAIG